MSVQEQVRYVVFVGGIPLQTTKEDLEAHFKLYGQVARITIGSNKRSKLPRGYAYVTMESEAAVSRILANFHSINGKVVDCEIAVRKSQKKLWKDEQRSRRVFLNNIPTTMTIDDLNKAFSVFGKVRTSNKIIGKSGVERQGYVEFSNAESVKRTLNEYSVSHIADLQIICFPYLARDQQPQKSYQPLAHESIQIDEYNYCSLAEANSKQPRDTPRASFFGAVINTKNMRKETTKPKLADFNDDAANSNHYQSIIESKPTKFYMRFNKMKHAAHDASNLRFNIAGRCTRHYSLAIQKLERRDATYSSLYYKLF